jgi:hypothetical protein
MKRRCASAEDRRFGKRHSGRNRWNAIASGRARAQSQEHLARYSARSDGHHHRPERLWKIDSRFDLLFAEGQRRFLDSMSPYARQFVEQLEKPDVDLISGLPPSVAIEQRITRGGGKSTVATSRRCIISCAFCSPSAARSFARSATCRGEADTAGGDKKA